MFLWFIVLLLCLQAPVVAATCRIHFESWSGEADSMEALLSLASHEFNRPSQRLDVEYVGVILSDVTKGRLRSNAGRGCRGVDRFALRVTELHGAVALWHTHGSAGPLRSYFSTSDAGLVRDTGLPLYLITAAGQIRVLTTKAVRKAPKKLRRFGSRLAVHGYPGEQVEVDPSGSGTSLALAAQQN